MQEPLLKAFQVLDSQATMTDMLEACRSLFVVSDEYGCALQPFDPSEVDAVANAIYEYILCPDDPSPREIVFTVHHSLEGKSIGYIEYASGFSEEMLYQNFSRPFASLDLDDLRRALKRYFVGILFRYAFCTDADWFPVSAILEYIGAVRMLLSREQRDGELSDAIFTTLAALRSLEPLYRMKEKAAEEAAQFIASQTKTTDSR